MVNISDVCLPNFAHNNFLILGYVDDKERENVNEVFTNEVNTEQEMNFLVKLNREHNTQFHHYINVLPRVTAHHNEILLS